MNNSEKYFEIVKYAYDLGMKEAEATTGCYPVSA